MKTRTSKKTAKPAATSKKATRRTVGDDILEAGAAAAHVRRARTRRGAQPVEVVAQAPAPVEAAAAPSAPEAAATAAPKAERKSPPAPEGTVKTLLRGSSAKALGFTNQRPEWLPAPVVSREGTPQESWRFNLEPATLAQLVLHLEASGQNGPVSKDAKYLRTLVPAGLLPAAVPEASAAAAE